jgi:hypothetical protein
MKTEKQTKTTTAPLSIDKAAQILKTDRRTLTQALQQAEQLDFITPHDFRGVRGCARYLLPDACEALELWRVRQAPLDMRRHCERMGNDYARALSMPCPRCGGLHQEMPILPLHGKRDTPELVAWFNAHGFPLEYPEAGPPHTH